MRRPYSPLQLLLLARLIEALASRGPVLGLLLAYVVVSLLGILLFHGQELSRARQKEDYRLRSKARAYR